MQQPHSNFIIRHQPTLKTCLLNGWLLLSCVLTFNTKICSANDTRDGSYISQRDGVYISQNETLPTDGYPQFSIPKDIYLKDSPYKDSYPSFSNAHTPPNQEPRSNIIQVPDAQIGSQSGTQTEAPSAFQEGQSTEENADIWQRIKDGYAMPDAKSALVKRHEKAFAQPKLINNIVDRGQKYLFHIVEEVQNRGMPTEIALLPMIESAYNPTAYSTSKAAGIWQFIPSTGKNYGLKQNWWVDNRRNITFATDAALSYLQKLHVMFGAWDLALAAYNAGEGTVRRAIEKNKKLGKPTNYANLDLPKETENYVPKLQAIKNIMTNPANFGIKLKAIENKAYFTTVTAPSQIDAKLVAELADISYEEFIALNPSFNRPVITASSDTQELLLPIDSVEKFHQHLATYDKPLVNWKPYHVKTGESLSAIAAQHDITLDKLRKINQLPNIKKFGKSTIILVPNKSLQNQQVATNSTISSVEPAPQNIASENLTAASAHLPENIKSAEMGMTVDALQNSAPAIESNVDIAALQNAGNIDPQHLQKLQEMQAQESLDKKTSEKKSTHQKNITYTVKKGDSLGKIAQKFNVSSKSISTQNNLKKNQVKIGQVLKFTTETTTSSNKTATDKKVSGKNSKSIKTKSTATKSKRKQTGKINKTNPKTVKK